MYISRHSSQKMGQGHPAQLAGVDKVEVSIRPGAFTVKDHNLLDATLNRKAGTEVPPLLVDRNGVEVYATKLYHNAVDGTKFDVNGRGLLVSFNPSKLHTRHPFELLTDPSQLMQVASHVMGLAGAVGLDFDLMGAPLYRVDPAKQAVVSDPPAQYGQALRYARGTRMARKEYPDGYLFHNRNRELCFYDKARQLNGGRKRSDTPVLVPDNLLRAEVRLMHNDTIAKDTGCTTYGELVNVNPLTLAKAYSRNMDRLLFDPLNAGQQLAISFEDDLAFVDQLATRYKRQALDVYERMHGTLNLLELHGGLEGYTRFVWALHDRGGVSRSAAYRKLSRIRRDLRERATLDTLRGQRSVATRLEEIRHIFTAIPDAA